MEFGYGLVSAQRPPGSSDSYVDVYEDAVELAQVAEGSGFDAVWLSEHHFFEDGYAPSVLPLAAALARETETMDVGTAVALAPLYDPVRLAEDAATVDLLSNGRFRLGLANGYVREEFETFSVPLSKRAPRVEDAVAVCRHAWSGERFSYDGYTVDLTDVRVMPPPARDDGPPVYLGGVAEAAVRRAGRIADGFVGIVYHGDDFGGQFTVAQFCENVERIRDVRGGDLDGFTAAIVKYANVANSDDEAWAGLLPHLSYLEGRYAQYNERDDPSRWDPETMSKERRAALREGALVGTPETIRERLRRLDERVPGDLHVVARLYHPTRSVEEQVEVVRRFGSEVIEELA